MIEVIFNFNNILGAFINAFAHIYVWSKLFDQKINFKSIKFYIINITLTFFLILNYILINDVIRIILLLVVLSVLCSFMFRKHFFESLVSSFFSQFIIMISELIFIFVVSVILNVDVNLLVSSYFVKMGSNLVISLIALSISNFKFIKMIYKFIMKSANRLKEYNVLFIMIIILISINFIFASIYNKLDLTFVVIMNVIISSIYLIICFNFIKAKDNYYRINNKYNNTLNSLREYEEILDVYRVSSHENKNQLLTIRSMIVKKEKNIPEYIDKIIDNRIKDDEKLMFDTNAIPAGGLRAVIYSKLLLMKDKKIDFKLNVDRKVRTVELIDLGEELILDVCKVIGVFLDNAIEAVSELKKKNISINLFADEEILNIEICNNYKGNIDLNKIDDKGYTSKSNGHGYGLSLVKEIINKNNNLINERRINKDIFIQKLKIKIK